MGDQVPEQQLAELLLALGLTVATAESCTGGLVSYRITTIAGSSRYFLGGVVAYSNALKETFLDVPPTILKEYGAVSRECALAMARGIRARTGADIGLATTGIAGPTGATARKPVGLVYIACVTPWGEVAEEHHWSGSREENIQAATEAVLSRATSQIIDQAAPRLARRERGTADEPTAPTTDTNGND